MTRYGVLLSCASEMVEPGLVAEYPDAYAATKAKIAASVNGIQGIVCSNDGGGWKTLGDHLSPREWLAQFQ
ncbi:hypothetical protein [Pseudoclavibacter helvolus]|uniref:hypothetical protein n=1 Tax=Pseudoclavibacter helvolus TaxID=255205 RepID=UPI003C73F72A